MVTSTSCARRPGDPRPVADATRPCPARGAQRADTGHIRTQQDIYEDPRPGDVLVIAGDRIDAHEQAHTPGWTVIVRFRARAMWARVIEFVPDEGHRVELLIAVHELAAPDGT